MEDKYSITIIPIGKDGKVIYCWRDFTTAAKTHFIEIDGTRYYIRENRNMNTNLREKAAAGLEAMFKGEKIVSPVTLTLRRE